MPGAWSFLDACDAEKITGNGGSFELHGHFVETFVGFGQAALESPYPHEYRDASHFSLPFAVGQGIGPLDITGSLAGRMAFPFYDRSRCVDDANAPTPCPGEAISYLVIVNGGKATVTFAKSPIVNIVAKGAFAGKKGCALDPLVWTNGATFEARWLNKPLATAPLSSDVLQFKAQRRQQTYPPAPSFAVFAVVCS